ncbi:enoyl-CoA hydratase/isomerase family protein (plasmid) [Streptomyces sp. NBC_01340]|uniref:(3,5-dihydroxyphenyl)acetyl-CoA 1,2-dioxygenase DpgC n=1 Tax=Streptomyces sp. NBC_01340 TaxID=2903830 RepID=UPI002E1215D7|nr:enoyl-CoA hydratase/isomerase family protein [Streptomyces sp. NBC_01340]
MNPTPVWSETFETDRYVAADHLTDTDRQLAALPIRPLRDPGQEQLAAALHATARRLRTEFLSRHAERVYDVLTDNRRSRPRLAELARSAAEAFPGLVPSPEQLAQEARLTQPDKEGREIDQGILFGALLAAPRAGVHLTESMRRPTPRALELLAEFRRTGEIVLDAARLERRAAAGHVTITNGHCLNAEDNQHVADMETLVDLVLLDPQVRVGVIRGGVMTHPRYAGRRVFSAGINLKAFKAGAISFVDFLLTRELGYISKIMRGLVATDAMWPASPVEKPWLAAVDTFAIGGGAQILLACDQVVAASDAYFSLPAANEGIVPGVANLRLTRYLGARPARQVILGGRAIRADEPDARLLFDDVFDSAEMDLAVEAAAERLDNPAVIANRHMLNLADEPEDSFRRYLAEFAVQQAMRAYSPDVLAKMAAPAERASGPGGRD